VYYKKKVEFKNLQSMKKLLVFYVLAVLIIYSCSNENLSVDDPQEAILGKWELTNLGTGPQAPPNDGRGSYTEYLPDSLLRNKNKGEGGSLYANYWFKDSLLFKKVTYLDAIDKDTIIFMERYKYEFINRNRLMLNWQINATSPTSIYKRIK